MVGRFEHVGVPRFRYPSTTTVTYAVERSPARARTVDLWLRLAELRQRSEDAALAWYDAGCPKSRWSTPLGAGRSLWQYHQGVMLIWAELARRADQDDPFSLLTHPGEPAGEPEEDSCA